MDIQAIHREGRSSRLVAVQRSRIVAALLLLGFNTLPLKAQEQGRVQDHLLSARRLYDDLEYERALEQLSEARRFSNGAEDDALLSLYEGVILADLGKPDDAFAAFKAALLLQPEAKLPVLVSPKVTQRFEAVRQQVKLELEAEAQRRMALVPPPATQAQPAAPVMQESGHRGSHSRAWLPATIGGGLLVSGGVSYLLARSEQSKLRGNEASLATLEDAKRSASRGRTYQWVGLSLASAGVVGLGISAGMYLLGQPSKSPPLGIDVSTDGTSAFVQGRWP
ncbi:hypothetical protein [Pyxidicoccus caerfyrddinensis]|uniref:hypothetical protein n=1 Tax=Pyxidicoccus caerfyrddinensis TaxID=2709663 RepID=UPI0013DC93AD|nr:hypothetical protein [Pyxidicoccus caerfyrddinensis]